MAVSDADGDSEVTGGGAIGQPQEAEEAVWIDARRKAVVDFIRGQNNENQPSHIRNLLLTHWNCVAKIHGSAALADVIPIPGRNFHIHIALNDALAAQSRFQRQSRGHVQAVRFVVIHFRKILQALCHNYVAGGAGAVSPAGMFEMDSKV